VSGFTPHRVGRDHPFAGSARHAAGPQAPLIATWLFGNRRSSHAIAIYIAICAVVMAVVTMVMTDCTGTDHAGEHGLR
jgi:hypothetical protein